MSVQTIKTEKEELEAQYAPYVDVNYAEMTAANFNWALTNAESEIIKNYEEVRLYSSSKQFEKNMMGEETPENETQIEEEYKQTKEKKKEQKKLKKEIRKKTEKLDM